MGKCVVCSLDKGVIKVKVKAATMDFNVRLFSTGKDRGRLCKYCWNRFCEDHGVSHDAKEVIIKMMNKNVTAQSELGRERRNNSDVRDELVVVKRY